MNQFFKRLKDEFLSTNNIVFKKFKPINKIGFGTYGNVYSAIRLKDKNMFAMKTEKTNALKKTLESEAYYLYILQGGFGIPKFISYGYSKNYYVLIETLLDKNLYSIFIENSKKCEIIDACLIGHQILDRLEWIHSKDLIYRDMKPSNFLIGKNDPNVIYIIDFGLCKKYRSSKTGKHLLPRKTGHFNGTLKYASSYVIKGKEPSRRDDLIALGYILIFFLKGELPWQQKCEVINKANYNELIHLKETDDNEKLFQNIPEEIVEYVKYTKNMKFEQNPDYSYLHSLFNKLLSKKSLNLRKLTFSWIDPKNKDLLGMPKSNSRRKPSHHKRLLNSIQEEIGRKFAEKVLNLNDSKNDNYNIKSINSNNNMKDEPNSHIIRFNLKKGLNESLFSYNICYSHRTNSLINSNYDINTQSYNSNKNLININSNNIPHTNYKNNRINLSLKDKQKNVNYKKSILTKKKFNYNYLTNLILKYNKNKRKTFIKNNDNNMKKNKRINHIKYKSSSNNFNNYFYNPYKTINQENINYIQNNKDQNLQFITLSNNIEYKSPLFEKFFKTNNKLEIETKKKYYNLIKLKTTNFKEFIFNKNNLKKNIFSNDINNNNNIFFDNIKYTNNENFFSSSLFSKETKNFLDSF